MLYNSRVVFNKTNIPFIFSTVFASITSYGRSGLIINSEDNTEGKWKGTNNYYTGETTNIYRTGGAPSSIKLFSKSNARIPLNIGYPGFKNIEVTAPGPGKYNIVTRFMHSNFATASTNFFHEYLIVYATVFQKINNQFVQKTFTSQLNGYWTSDEASMWNNEEYMKPVLNKIPITLETGNAETYVISIRLEYDLYDANGRFYFDPAVELEPIVSYSYHWTDAYDLIVDALTPVVNADSSEAVSTLAYIKDADGYDEDLLYSYLTEAASSALGVNGRQYTFAITDLLVVLRNSIADDDPKSLFVPLMNMYQWASEYFTTDRVTITINKAPVGTVDEPDALPSTPSFSDYAYSVGSSNIKTLIWDPIVNLMTGDYRVDNQDDLDAIGAKVNDIATNSLISLISGLTPIDDVIFNRFTTPKTAYVTYAISDILNSIYTVIDADVQDELQGVLDAISTDIDSVLSVQKLVLTYTNTSV
jgi:hypothetical protein